MKKLVRNKKLVLFRDRLPYLIKAVHIYIYPSAPADLHRRQRPHAAPQHPVHSTRARKPTHTHTDKHTICDCTLAAKVTWRTLALASPRTCDAIPREVRGAASSSMCCADALTDRCRTRTDGLSERWTLSRQPDPLSPTPTHPPPFSASSTLVLPPLSLASIIMPEIGH